MKALLLLLALFFPSGLMAHEVRPAIATAVLAPDGAVEMAVTLNLEAVMAGIDPDHDDTGDSPQAPEYDRLRALDPASLRAAFDDFAPRFIDGIALTPPDQSSRPFSVVRVKVPPVGDLGLPRVSEIVLAGAIPPGSKRIVWRFAPSFGDSVIRLKSTGADDLFHSQHVTGGMSEPITLDPSLRQGWTAVFVDYVELGFVHIVPKGLDHILFVVGLFLLSTRMSALLWQVTAFTLAHTVTLAMGVTGMVAISPAIVEPLIAASIVYIAVENLLTKRLHPWRPAVVFCFGLLHGLGFAGVLEEVGLSQTHFVTGLVAFNIGVELGQLTVIAACFLLAGWAMRLSYYRQAFVVPGSLAVAIIAAFWTVERLA